MSKTLVHELNYDAPVDRVAAMLADPAFREDVCRAQHATDINVTTDREGGALKIVVDQWQPTDGVPAVAKKIVGDKTNIVQTERWASETAAEVTVQIPGKPGDITGTSRLSEKAAGTVHTVELTIKVGIPLVGGKLEAILSDLLLKALKTENRVGQKYLAG